MCSNKLSARSASPISAHACTATPNATASRRCPLRCMRSNACTTMRRGRGAGGGGQRGGVKEGQRKRGGGGTGGVAGGRGGGGGGGGARGWVEGRSKESGRERTGGVARRRSTAASNHQHQHQQQQQQHAHLPHGAGVTVAAQRRVRQRGHEGHVG